MNFRKGQIDRLERLGFCEDGSRFILNKDGYFLKVHKTCTYGNYCLVNGLSYNYFMNFERLINFLKDLAN